MQYYIPSIIEDPYSIHVVGASSTFFLMCNNTHRKFLYFPKIRVIPSSLPAPSDHTNDFPPAYANTPSRDLFHTGTDLCLSCCIAAFRQPSRARDSRTTNLIFHIREKSMQDVA